MANNNADERLLSDRRILWSGFLTLRHWFSEQSVPVNLYFVAGNISLPRSCFPQGPLMFKDVVKAEGNKLKEINGKTALVTQHTLLVALPNVGENKVELYENAQRLNTFVVEYLKLRNSYAVVKFADLSVEEGTFSLYVFPHGDFAAPYLKRLIPDDFPKLIDSAYLLLLLTSDYDEE